MRDGMCGEPMREQEQAREEGQGRADGDAIAAHRYASVPAR